MVRYQRTSVAASRPIAGATCAYGGCIRPILARAEAPRHAFPRLGNSAACGKARHPRVIFNIPVRPALTSTRRMSMPVDGKTRKDAWAIVEEFTDSENLRRHMLAAEAGMRGYARIFGEDEEKWGLVGLLHDFDYEKYQGPNGHPFVGVQILDK